METSKQKTMSDARFAAMMVEHFRVTKRPNNQSALDCENFLAYMVRNDIH